MARTTTATGMASYAVATRSVPAVWPISAGTSCASGSTNCATICRARSPASGSGWVSDWESSGPAVVSYDPSHQPGDLLHICLGPDLSASGQEWYVKAICLEGE